MRRVAVIALAFGFLAPVGEGNAQMTSNGQPWAPQIRITPVVGQAPQFNRTERWSYADGLTVGNTSIETAYAAGPVVGGVLEVGQGRFGLIAAGMFVNRKSTIDFETLDVNPGSNFLLAKVGVALRLREPVSELQLRRLTASVFAAPALVREMPKKDETVVNGLSDPINHWGVNFGMQTEIPVHGDALALQLGVEDFVVWWNEAEIADRFNEATGFTEPAAVDTDPSHMWMVRLGLSFAVK